LRDKLREAKDGYWSEQVYIQQKVASAWVLYAEGKYDDALSAMSAAADAEPVRFDVAGYRETRSVGMLTLADEAGGATRLAHRLHDELETLGVYRREARPWLPHVTVLRFRERPRLRPEPAALSWVSSDAAALLSRLHPSGARYEVHDSFRLGG